MNSVKNRSLQFWLYGSILDKFKTLPQCIFTCRSGKSELKVHVFNIVAMQGSLGVTREQRL